MQRTYRSLRRVLGAALGSVLLAGAAVAATSAPASSQTVTPFPNCGGGTTQECIVAFTVDGAAPPAGVSLEVTKVGTTALDVKVLRSGGAQGGVELSPALTVDSDIHVEINTGTLDPLMLAFTGDVTSFAPALDATNGNTAAFDVSPVAVAWKASGCAASGCGDNTTKADADLAAAAVGQIVAPATGSTAAVNDDLRGSWLSTNAQAIGTPTFNATTDTLSVTLAAAHLRSDGTANDDGSVTTFLPTAALTDQFGIANPAAATSESLVTVKTQTGLLTAEVSDKVEAVAGGLELSVPVFGYSNPKFDITKATTSAGRSATVGIASTPSGNGYWLADASGGVWAFGDAGVFGSLAGIPLNKPIVGIASTPSGNGYYLVATDGGVFTFGDATFRGSTGALTLNQPIVGMAVTPSGNGYYLVASDGGVFTFGDGVFRGSMGSTRLNQPVVGMDVVSGGGGYWLVAADGGIFSFGNATFFGSTGSLVLNKPVVGMEGTADSAGYWLVASDGGIFRFGNAPFLGSLGSLPLVQPIVGMAALPNASGYRLAARDGGLFALGAATYLGGRAI